MIVCISRPNKSAYSETFIENHVTGLSKLNQVVNVYGGWKAKFKGNGSRIQPFPIWVFDLIIEKVTGKRCDFLFQFQIKKYFKKIRPCVVLAEYGLSGVELTKVCSELNLPLVVHFHGFDISHRPTLKLYGNRYRKMFSVSSALVAVSADMRNGLIEAGAPVEKIKVIPYGVDLNFFQYMGPNVDSSQFIAVGRLTEKKAPDLTILAFSQIASDFPDATLVFIGGDAGMEMNCRTLLKKLSLEKRVTFLGVKSSIEIITEMKKSIAFLQHSITASDGDSEGTPNAILEASALGLPVISTQHAGIKEAVIHGVTGFLVPEKDVNGMSFYMRSILQDRSIAIQFGKKGRIHMESQYDLNRQIQKLHDLLSSFCN
jgi:glycosyltransferase involved in cell wall biosynthesis